MDLSRTSFFEDKPAAAQQDVVIYEDPNFGYAERVLEKLGAYSNFPMFTVSCMASLLICFVVCNKAYGEQKCFKYADRVFYVLFFLCFVIVTLKVYRNVRYWMNAHKRAHGKSAEKASCSSGPEAGKTSSYESSFKH